MLKQPDNQKLAKCREVADGSNLLAFWLKLVCRFICNAPGSTPDASNVCASQLDRWFSCPKCNAVASELYRDAVGTSISPGFK